MFRKNGLVIFTFISLFLGDLASASSANLQNKLLPIQFIGIIFFLLLILTFISGSHNEEIKKESYFKILRATKNGIFAIGSGWYRLLVGIVDCTEVITKLFLVFMFCSVWGVSGIIQADFNGVSFFLILLFNLYISYIISLAVSVVFVRPKYVWITFLSYIFRLLLSGYPPVRRTAAFVFSGNQGEIKAKFYETHETGQMTDEEWADYFVRKKHLDLVNLENVSDLLHLKDLPSYDFNIRSNSDITSPIFFKEIGFLRLYAAKKLVGDPNGEKIETLSDWELYLIHRNLNATFFEKILNELDMKSDSKYLAVCLIFCLTLSSFLSAIGDDYVLAKIWDYILIFPNKILNVLAPL